MCRFVAYLGHPLLMEDILVHPTNSIILQSLHARESSIPTNGDGFGLGWYAPEINETPALFTSMLPAWSDQNLRHLTAKIQSNCFFAHVRAASTGGINPYNCHPFINQKWMFMHNGGIGGFIGVKRHLRHLLDDDIYNCIRGETDSEHFFALFMQIAKNQPLERTEVVVEILKRTIATVNQLVFEYGQGENSTFNFCLTDGERIFASRYCSDPQVTPETLHYFLKQPAKNYHLRIKIKDDAHHPSVLIASEKLTDYHTEWQDVPANHFVIADYNWKISVIPVYPGT